MQRLVPQGYSVKSLTPSSQYFLQPGLQQLIKARARVCGELRTVAILTHASTLQDHDLVRTMDGAQAMCNDDRRAILEKLVDSAFEALFRSRVQPRGGFVENDESRVAQEDARERQQLR